MADSMLMDVESPEPAQDLRSATGGMPELRERSPELLDILASGQPAAFASDRRDRIVFWNHGAAEMFGRRSQEVLGRRCYEAIGGRDVFGNRFCYANCPVVASLTAGETVAGFELQVSTNGRRRLAHVAVLRIPGVRPDLYTIVHILSPIDPEGRVARALAASGAGAAAPPTGCALAADQAATAPPLTGREREILQWVAAGLQNKEIAQKLDLSLATVRNHIHNILKKLEVHSKLEAVSLAFRSGWVRRADTRAAP